MVSRVGFCCEVNWTPTGGNPTLGLLLYNREKPEEQADAEDLKDDDNKHCLLLKVKMTHIPSKEEMIAAIRTSGCPRLNGIAYQYMTAMELYTALMLAKCPCLAALMKKRSSTDSSSSHA